MKIAELLESKKIKQRLDPKCWTGWHKDGTKINGVDIFFKRIPSSDDMPIVYTHSITTVNEERRLDIDL